LIADNQEEAVMLIQAIEQLSPHGLSLNKDKTQILTDREDLKSVKTIEGIEVRPQIKYLGLNVMCDRGALIKETKKNCRKFLGFVRGRIQTKDKELFALIMGAFYRSLICYYFTPLLGAGVVSKAQIHSFELQQIRKQHLMPNDIKSQAI